MSTFLGIFLTLHAVVDAKSGYIYLPLVWVQMAVGFFGGCLQGRDLLELCIRLLPGACLFPVSYVTRERIGRGDAWLLMAAGLYLKLWQQLYLWSLASVLAFLWTMWQFIRHRVDKEAEIAFAPFVWLGYLGGVCCGWF